MTKQEDSDTKTHLIGSNKCHIFDPFTLFYLSSLLCVTLLNMEWQKNGLTSGLLLHHVQFIKTWRCGRFLVDPRHAGLRSFDTQEVFSYLKLPGRNLLLNVSYHWKKTGNNWSVQTQQAAVMSGLDRAVYLSDLPGWWKSMPPMS